MTTQQHGQREYGTHPMKVPGHPADCDCWRCAPPTQQWTERPGKTPEQLAREERGRKWIPGSVPPPRPVQSRTPWHAGPGVRVLAGVVGAVLLAMATTPVLAVIVLLALILGVLATRRS